MMPGDVEKWLRFETILTMEMSNSHRRRYLVMRVKSDFLSGVKKIIYHKYSKLTFGHAWDGF